MNIEDVCNLALGRIGQGASNFIANIDEESEDAYACRRVFGHCMSMLLSEHDWKFAQKSAALTLSTQEIPGWLYAYQYPSDCVFLRYVTYSDNDPRRAPNIKIPYRIVASTDGQSQMIATDMVSAYAHYTMRITNPAFCTPQFNDALAWRLAAELALILRSSPAMSQSAMNQYQYARSVAVSMNFNESEADPAPVPLDVAEYGATFGATTDFD